MALGSTTLDGAFLNRCSIPLSYDGTTLSYYHPPPSRLCARTPGDSI